MLFCWEHVLELLVTGPEFNQVTRLGGGRKRNISSLGRQRGYVATVDNGGSLGRFSPLPW